MLVAFGSCAHEGCIPGLANLSNRKEVFDTVYRETVSTEKNLPWESRLARRAVLLAAEDQTCPQPGPHVLLAKSLLHRLARLVA